METTWNSVDKTWSGPPRNWIYGDDISVGQVIFTNMKNWPSHVCQISDIDGVSLTNEQALTWAIRIALFFKRRGLDHNSVIGIVAANTTYVMSLAVGCLMNATPFHAVNGILDENTIRHMFQLTKPSLIFCDKQHYAKVYEATKAWQPELYTVSEPMEGKPSIQSLLQPTTAEKSYRPVRLVNGRKQTAVIICSSGTTGMPKAVCIANDVLWQDNLLVNGESIFFIQSTLDWISGLWAFIFSAGLGSTRILSDKPFSPESFVELVKKYKINYVTMAPFHMAALAASPAATPAALASLRDLNYGGCIASDTTLSRMKLLCPTATINSCYAMSEAGGIALNLGVKNAAAAGKPMPGMTVRIVDENGINQGPNVIGEIHVHTGGHWNGYYNDPEATREMQDAEGWFHTGDLGYFDDEHYLYIVDRIKEVLKYQGIHYWPTEIENTIKELPEVRDVCVVGVPDEFLGDAAGALVIRSPGVAITEAAIVEHVAKRLPTVVKQLHAGVRFAERLPMNHNGKFMRKAALKLFQSLSPSPA